MLKLVLSLIVGIALGVHSGNINLEKLEIPVERVNIKMVGDDLIHTGVYKQCYQSDGSYNFDKIFEHIKSDIESADIGIINQETILVHDKSRVSSYPAFGTPDDIGHSIVRAGFDVVAHSTNHTIDKGESGIRDTIDFWETNYPEMIYLGVHKDENDSDIRYITKNNIKISFINYTYGLNGLEGQRKGKEYLIDMLSDKDIEESIKEAKENSDIIVAILHIGEEYVYKPTEYERKQVDRFIDNGVEIVLCSHPHVLEPYGIRVTENGNKGLVYYSLGNFVSSQNEVDRVVGGMADITITKDILGKVEIENYDLIPLVTHQESGLYTTYKLSDYTEDLAKRHKLRGKGLSLKKIDEILEKTLGKDIAKASGLEIEEEGEVSE